MDEHALRVDDVASILGVSRNLIYRLAKEGALPSYHVGRKLRFTADDVDAYLHGSSAPVSPAADKPIDDATFLMDATESKRAVKVCLAGRGIICDLLADHLDGLGIGVTRSYRDGYAALVSTYLGYSDLAVISLWDGTSRTCNIPYIKRLMPGTSCIALSLGTVGSGLLVRRGNPKRIRSWLDLLHDGVTLINREAGSPQRILLDEHLIRLEAIPARVAGYDRIARSGLALADLVAHGGADVGVGDEELFHRVDGLDYLPLQTDEVALVIRKSALTTGLVALIRDLLRSRSFQDLFASVPGIDAHGMGQAIYEV